MQFRLIYKGRLPAESRSDARTRDKQRIRREVHRQLRELWKTHHFLKRFLAPSVRRFTLNENMNAPTIESAQVFLPEYEPGMISVAQKIASRFEYKGYRFLPLIGETFSGVATACSFDVLFLRRDDPGRLVSGGGDIDNRIKVLLDALKMPRSGDNFQPDSNPGDDENPFFCLVEDDSLISELRVATDRLLTPPSEGEHVNDVHLVIHVRSILLRTGGAPDGGAAAAFAT